MKQSVQAVAASLARRWQQQLRGVARDKAAADERRGGALMLLLLFLLLLFLQISSPRVGARHERGLRFEAD